MTGPARQHARTLIDQAVRARVAQEDAPFAVQRCAGCQCDLDTYVAGCPTCWNRRSYREIRGRK